MKILLKRNQNSSTQVSSVTLGAGEPLWLKDRLYIGSVGATAGGTSGAAGGDPIPVATSVTGVAELELSTTAQTYLTVDGTQYKLKLPVSAANHNQTITSKNGSAAAVSFGADDAVQLTSGAGISVTGNATNKTVTFAHTNSVTAETNVGGNTNETPGYGSTFSVPYFSYDTEGHITASGTKTVTIPASDDTNQKVKAGSVTFGDNDVVNFVAGSNITVTGDATAKTITIANTYSHPSAGTNTGSFGPSADASPAHEGTFTVPYITVNSDGHVTAAANKTITLPAGYTHPTYTSHAATGGLSGTTLTVPIVTVDGTGHVSALSSASIEFTHTPSSTEKVLTSTDLTGIVGAMVYKGTIGTGGTITTLPTASDANKGYVYMVKTAGTYASQACEVGDMIVSNGTSWDVINGENQVTNTGTTLEWGNATTIATVDGTNITATLPANPNTWRSVQVNGTEKLGTATTTGALNIKNGTTITVDWDTTSPAGVKINHATPTGASAKTTQGGVSGNTITVPVVSTDAQGHVTGLTTESWTYTAPAAPGNGGLKVQANSGTASSLFTANQATGTDSTLKFVDGSNTTVTQSTSGNVTTVTVNASHPTISNASAHTTASIYSFKTDANGHVTDATAKSFSTDATTGKFADSSNVITLTEIDGGTF